VEILECIEGCYEIQDVEFGKVYRWCPECVMVECDCGENPTLTCSESVCVRCGPRVYHPGRVSRPAAGRLYSSPLALRRVSRRRRNTLLTFSGVNSPYSSRCPVEI